MDIAEWRAATSPKVIGSWNLHELLPAGMDFFILLSSVAGIFGNVGQSNYCAGNTYEDALARYRISIGEKALSIDLGVVLGEGYVADNLQVMERLLQLNLFRPNSLDEIFAMLDYGCNPDLQLTEPSQSQIITGFELPADIESNGRDVPSAMEQPIFRYMRQAEGSTKRSQNVDSHVRTFRSTFTAAESASAGALVVAEALRMKVGRVLGLPVENITTGSALDSYGVDSLVGLELRNWLSKESGADLAVFEILGGATLLKIGQMVAAKSSLRPAVWASEAED
jgi:hypothetical protein